MGRGRAKAKQTKVARELKYSSPGMDLDRLARDLKSDSPAGAHSAAGDVASDNIDSADVDDDEFADDDEDERADYAAG